MNVIEVLWNLAVEDVPYLGTIVTLGAVFFAIKIFGLFVRANKNWNMIKAFAAHEYGNPLVSLLDSLFEKVIFMVRIIMFAMLVVFVYIPFDQFSSDEEINFFMIGGAVVITVMLTVEFVMEARLKDKEQRHIDGASDGLIRARRIFAFFAMIASIALLEDRAPQVIQGNEISGSVSALMALVSLAMMQWSRHLLWKQKKRLKGVVVEVLMIFPLLGCLVFAVTSEISFGYFGLINGGLLITAIFSGYLVVAPQGRPRPVQIKMANADLRRPVRRGDLHRRPVAPVQAETPVQRHRSAAPPTEPNLKTAQHVARRTHQG